MSKGLKLFILVLIFIGGVSAVVILFHDKNTPSQKDLVIETHKAVAQAKILFRVRLAGGVDMENGPCLSDDFMPDWVVDVVHTPRNEVDNLPDNQCPSFRSGKTTHFVELDTSGNLVRAR